MTSWCEDYRNLLGYSHTSVYTVGISQWCEEQPGNEGGNALLMRGQRRMAKQEVYSNSN